MKIRIAWLLLTAFAGLEASDAGTKVHYVGGTGAGIGKCGGRIAVDGADAVVFAGKDGEVRIPYRDINTLEYGEHVSRRYLEAILISPLFMMAKKKSHFLTIGFTTPDGQQQAMVFKMESPDVRLLLVTLEARTGRRVEYQDDEARKDGKG